MNPASESIADPAYRTLAELLRQHARECPDSPALLQDGARLSYAELDFLMDRIAASLQRDGLRPGDAIGICASASVRYAALFLGALRAGVVVAPLAAA